MFCMDWSLPDEKHKKIRHSLQNKERNTSTQRDTLCCDCLSNRRNKSFIIFCIFLMSFEQLAYFLEYGPWAEYIGLIFLFNVAITLVEIILDFTTSKERRRKDTGANIVIFAVGNVLEMTLYGSIGVIFLLWFQQFAFFTIQETWWTWLLAVVCADLTYYWMHRIEHHSRLLRASHSVHHSSEDYNLTIGFRLSIVEALFEYIFLVPMILLGFSPLMTIVAIIIVAQYQHWIHTEKITTLGFLDSLFNTPSNHRVHHGSNKQYLDKNFGGILMIWDKLFGTYEPEKEKVVYGLTKNINTNNPVSITFIEFYNIRKDLKRCRSRSERVRVVFGDLQQKPPCCSKK